MNFSLRQKEMQEWPRKIDSHHNCKLGWFGCVSLRSQRGILTRLRQQLNVGLEKLSLVDIGHIEVALCYLFNYLAAIRARRGTDTLRSLSLGRIAYRAWYYFRMGYATYLTYLIGFVSTLITVYYLAIKSAPPILDIFPHFAPFAILATVIGVPLSVAVGWIHLKRSRLYSSEQDINVEASPYSYKLIPGYWKEAFTPFYLEMLIQVERLLEAQGMLGEEDKKRIQGLREKMQVLIDGGYVGTPRRSNAM